MASHQSPEDGLTPNPPDPRSGNPLDDALLPSIPDLVGHCSHSNHVQRQIISLSTISARLALATELFGKTFDIFRTTIENPPASIVSSLSTARDHLRCAEWNLDLPKRMAVHFPPGSDILSCVESTAETAQGLITDLSGLMQNPEDPELPEHIKKLAQRIIMAVYRIEYTQTPIRNAIDILRQTGPLNESA